MPDAPVLGAGSDKVKLDDGAFGARFNGPLVHQSVRAEQAERGSLAILDVAEFTAPRTRVAFDLLDGWAAEQPTLVVLGADEDNAALSFRNIAGVNVLASEEVGVSDVVGAASLLLSKPALEALSSRAGARVRG